MPARRPPRITRAQACALLIRTGDLTPDARTVLMVDDTGRREVVSPNSVLDGRSGRIALTRAELLDAGVRVVPRSGARLAAGSGPRLDALLADVNARLAESWGQP